MPRRDCFHLLQICLQNVPDKSNSVFIESLFIESINTSVLNSCRQYQEISDLLFSSDLTSIYEYLHCVICLWYLCALLLYCVCSFSFFLFFCLMIGKTFVMFGYANKEFEFLIFFQTHPPRQQSGMTG